MAWRPADVRFQRSAPVLILGAVSPRDEEDHRKNKHDDERDFKDVAQDGASPDRTQAPSLDSSLEFLMLPDGTPSQPEFAARDNTQRSACMLKV